jgi:hypothetical protein
MRPAIPEVTQETDKKFIQVTKKGQKVKGQCDGGLCDLSVPSRGVRERVCVCVKWKGSAASHVVGRWSIGFGPEASGQGSG